MSEVVRVTHHLFEGDSVVFFDGGQLAGTAHTGVVVAHTGDEVTITSDGKRYYVARDDVVLR